MDRFQSMRIFGRVARLGSFTAAARELGLSPAVVSRKVAALEAHLGARLIERTTRRLRLTTAGERFLLGSERILEDLGALEDEAGEAGSGLVGTLRVSAPQAFGASAVAPLLPDFLAAHPRLRVDLQLSDAYLDLVEQGFDVAVRAGAIDDASLIGRRIGETASLLVASPAYLARRGTPPDLASLSEHDALCDTNRRDPQWTFGADRAADPSDPAAKTSRAPAAIRIRPRVRLSINHPQAVRDAAIAGLGVARLPHFAVDEALSSGRLVELLPERGRETIPVRAVYPRHRERTPKVERFVAHLVAHFALPRVPPAERRPASLPTLAR